MWISFIFQYILNMFPISSFPGTDEDATGRATCEVGKGGKIGGIGGPVIAKQSETIGNMLIQVIKKWRFHGIYRYLELIYEFSW